MRKTERRTLLCNACRIPLSEVERAAHEASAAHEAVVVAFLGDIGIQRAIAATAPKGMHAVAYVIGEQVR